MDKNHTGKTREYILMAIIAVAVILLHPAPDVVCALWILYAAAVWLCGRNERYFMGNQGNR